jgi:hypothetical protein
MGSPVDMVGARISEEVTRVVMADNRILEEAGRDMEVETRIGTRADTEI